MQEMREIPGYEGLYAVTAHGMVWSHPRQWTGMRGQAFSHDGKWLRTPLSLGYPVARLTDRNGRQSTRLVHRLLALAWIPNPDSLPEVNHINGNPKDCRLDNLEWCTRSHNMRHAYSAGLISITPEWRERARSMGLATRRLSLNDAAQIRSLVAAGAKQMHVAEQFGISRSAVYKIVKFRSYQR